MQIFLPILRADFSIHETYTYQPEPALSCGITVLAGQDDQEVPYADQQTWRDETLGEFRSQQLPGGHLFLQSSQEAVLRIVADTLQRACSAG
jgi:surfactin synthase thioesterase subunit